MATKPLTKEAIALTEKKMGMSLDDIIKMSKNTSNKGDKKQQRPLNKHQNVFNNAPQAKAFKVKQYVDSRSSVRQGFLAQRRSNFQGNQFPLATDTARNTAAGPRNRGFNFRRGANSDKARVGGPTFRRRAATGGFASKDSQQQRGKAGPEQKPQTLDSLFANLKEQRMRAFSRQNNYVQSHVKTNGGSKRRPPWVRARFGN